MASVFGPAAGAHDAPHDVLAVAGPVEAVSAEAVVVPAETARPSIRVLSSYIHACKYTSLMHKTKAHFPNMIPLMVSTRQPENPPPFTLSDCLGYTSPILFH